MNSDISKLCCCTDPVTKEVFVRWGDDHFRRRKRQHDEDCCTNSKSLKRLPCTTSFARMVVTGTTGTCWCWWRKSTPKKDKNELSFTQLHVNQYVEERLKRAQRKQNDELTWTMCVWYSCHSHSIRQPASTSGSTTRG